MELLSGQELDGTRLEVELTFPTRIKQALTQVRVGLPVSIGDSDAQVVQGRTAAGTLVTLFFDMETGLLTRLMRYTDSPVGRIVTQYDYDDYRPVAGVRIPFKWTRTWLDGRSVFQLTDVQPNVNVPPDRFAGPPQRALTAAPIQRRCPGKRNTIGRRSVGGIHGKQARDRRVVVGFAFSVPLFAHHGAASFDTGKTVTVKGTVTEYVWSNPHVLVKVDVKDDAGNVMHWVTRSMESRSPRPAEAGARTSFKAGDEVSLDITPAKNNQPIGEIRGSIEINGKEFKQQN